MIGKTLDPNGFELQDDGVVTSSHTEVVSDVDELREQIKCIQGHCMHSDSNKNCWYNVTYDKLVKQERDYDVAAALMCNRQDDKLLALITSYTHDRETEARIDTARHIDEHIIGSPRRITVNEKMADYITALKATRKDGI